jgi:predicted Fe-Mo cluster-binding NifX family protein
MHHVVVSVAPSQEPSEHLSLEAIRAIAKQDVSAVITGNIKDICRQTLLELGIDVISGVQGMTVIEGTTVREALELCERGELEEIIQDGH